MCLCGFHPPRFIMRGASSVDVARCGFRAALGVGVARLCAGLFFISNGSYHDKSTTPFLSTDKYSASLNAVEFMYFFALDSRNDLTFNGLSFSSL